MKHSTPKDGHCGLSRSSENNTLLGKAAGLVAVANWELDYSINSTKKLHHVACFSRISNLNNDHDHREMLLSSLVRHPRRADCDVRH